MYNKHEIQWDQAAGWSLWTPSPKSTLEDFFLNQDMVGL